MLVGVTVLWWFTRWRWRVPPLHGTVDTPVGEQGVVQVLRGWGQEQRRGAGDDAVHLHHLLLSYPPPRPHGLRRARRRCLELLGTGVLQPNCPGREVPGKDAREEADGAKSRAQCDTVSHQGEDCLLQHQALQLLPCRHRQGTWTVCSHDEGLWGCCTSGGVRRLELSISISSAVPGLELSGAVPKAESNV